MDDVQISLVQESFAKVVPIKDTAAALFYADLFETSPAMEALFEGADMEAQGQKLMATIAVVVDGLVAPDGIIPAAEDLAMRHVEYGVKAEDYDAVGASLLRTLARGLGDDFTPEVEAAWTEAYTILADVMKRAAYG